MSATQMSLSERARGALWRIFGPGSSPFTDRDAHDLAPGVLAKLIDNEVERELAIVEVQGWFETYGERRWLASAYHGLVAEAVVKSIADNTSPKASWALGAVDHEHIVRAMHEAEWRPEQIDRTIEHILQALESACHRDEIFDPTRVHTTRLGGGNVRLPKQALMSTNLMATFDRLNRFGLDLLDHGMYTSITNLIGLILELRPARLAELVARLDHPVLQLFAVREISHRTRLSDHRGALGWIRAEASDALLALAIFETLTTINALDADRKAADQSWAHTHTWRTELRPEHDDLGAAARALARDLAAQLMSLGPEAGVRWIGELLSRAPHQLHSRSQFHPPERLEQLEEACIEELVALATTTTWTASLTEHLAAGLRQTRLTTSSRHIAQLAWLLRDTKPTVAHELAEWVLANYHQHLKAEVGGERMFVRWEDWQTRRWTAGLGAALALTNNTQDIVGWVRDAAMALPSSVWDAESRYARFMAADRGIQHLCLIACHSAGAARILERPIPPDDLHELGELMWAHFQFANVYLMEDARLSNAAEFLARTLVAYGKVPPSLLLASAKHPGFGPRALLGMLEQGSNLEQLSSATRELLVEVLSEAFGQARGKSLLHLRYWGQLWLKLGIAAGAEATLVALETQSNPRRSREDRILTLELASFVAKNSHVIARDEMWQRYRNLWPSTYTEAHERSSRERVEQYLAALGPSSNTRGLA